jgi:response regulator RpfG family c-di-GMP phosphodiesterase
MNAKVLCVDDDPNVLAGFQRNLRKSFAIETANGGDAALELLQRQGPYAVIVADMRMPGMDGVQLLAEVMRRAPDTVRLMLTGNADQQTAVHAVNEGRIFRFLNKPCSTEDLAAALRAGLEQHRLIRAERELLEETLNGSVALLTDVLSIVEPGSFGRGQALRKIMRSFAESLGTASRWDLELGAMLSQLGCVTLPPQLLLKMRGGSPMTVPEQELVMRIPELGARLLARIPRLEPVSRIVLYQAKRFDGAGYPCDHVAGQDIPIGSRILKVMGDLEALEALGMPKAKALREMSQRKGWYDPDVLSAAYRCFDVCLPQAAQGASEDLALPLRSIHVGALLLEDVKTSDGLLIVKGDTLLSVPLLERLRNFASTHGVREPILVRVPAVKEESKSKN